jgi:hypothetical protein
MNRFQFNFKKSVGAVSEEIRKCSPSNLQEWEDYYFSTVRSREYIEGLGKKLYIKIVEVIESEIKEITEEDCIRYMMDMVTKRTYDGYTTEITTIYGQLEEVLGIKITAAPDEWDRKFNVDFSISVGEYFIGIQIKPVSDVSHISRIHKERELQKKSHEKFTKKYGGKVFYVLSAKSQNRKVIQNPDVIQEIMDEIVRLQELG